VISQVPIDALVVNASLLLLVVLVIDLAVTPHLIESVMSRRLMMGVVLGAIGVGVMTAPMTLLPGLVFDVRSVLLAVSGLFFGAWPTAVAMAMTAAYRLFMGGIGAWPGVVVILSSGLIGIAWRHRRRPPLDALSWRELLMLGLSVHLVMLAELSIMLWQIVDRAVAPVALPILVLYPVLTAALGRLLSRRLAYQSSLRALEQSEQRYHSLFDNSHTVMLIVDPDSGAIVAANPAAASYYGWTQEQLATMTLAELAVAPVAWNGAAVGPASTAQGNCVEVRHRRADGTVRDVEVFRGPMQVDGRQVLHLIVHDIGTRKEAQARLADSEVRRGAEQAAALEAQHQGRLAALNLMEDAVAARTRAEASLAELQESKERLKLALQAANQGIYDIDLQTGEVIVSPEYVTMLGYDPAEFRETRAAWIERMHPDDRRRVFQAAREYLADELPEFRAEFRQRTRAGDWIWVLSLGRVVARDAAGRPLRMLGTHTDITEHKRAEAERRALEARYRDLFDANPHPMWVYDLETLAFLAVNDAAVEHYGYSREEFLAMTIRDIRPAEDVPAMLQGVADVRRGSREIGVWRHRKKDGGLILVEIVTHPLDFGGRSAQAVLAHDVTQAKQVEAALRASEALNRSTLDSVGAEIAVLDRDGTITAVNRPWRRFAEENGSVPGRPVPGTGVGDNYLAVCGDCGGASGAEGFDPCEGIRAVLERRLPSFSIEYPCHSPGRQRWFSMSVTPLGEDGLGAVVAHSDITGRRQAEDKVMQQLRELQQWYDLTLGREDRVLELKAEVNALRRKLGEAPRYPSVEAGEAAPPPAVSGREVA
jgi:PAS domain S-box-containing protein